MSFRPWREPKLTRVDLDAYIELHRPEWEELEDLIGRSGFRTSRLTAAEGDRLLALYQRVGTHLTVVRSHDPDPELVAWLSQLVARARHRAVRSGARGWSDVGRWFTATLPAALWVMRGWWLTTIIVCTLFTVAAGWYFLQNPQIESSLLSAEQVEQLVQHDFADYYSEYAATDFALRVWTNNAWIAATCIAFGILGLPVLYILLLNSANLALTGSIMINHGAADVFFGLILPHGLLELTAVFVAGGVGREQRYRTVDEVAVCDGVGRAVGPVELREGVGFDVAVEDPAVEGQRFAGGAGELQVWRGSGHGMHVSSGYRHVGRVHPGVDYFLLVNRSVDVPCRIGGYQCFRCPNP